MAVFTDSVQSPTPSPTHVASIIVRICDLVCAAPQLQNELIDLQTNVTCKLRPMNLQPSSSLHNTWQRDRQMFICRFLHRDNKHFSSVLPVIWHMNKLKKATMPKRERHSKSSKAAISWGNTSQLYWCHSKWSCIFFAWSIVSVVAYGVFFFYPTRAELFLEPASSTIQGTAYFRSASGCRFPIKDKKYFYSFRKKEEGRNGTKWSKTVNELSDHFLMPSPGAQKTVCCKYCLL